MLLAPGGHTWREQASAHLTSTVLCFKSYLPLLPARIFAASSTASLINQCSLLGSRQLLQCFCLTFLQTRAPGDLMSCGNRLPAPEQFGKSHAGAVGPGPTSAHAAADLGPGLSGPPFALPFAGVITSPTKGVGRHSSCTCLGLTQLCRGQDEARRAEVTRYFRRARTPTSSGGWGGAFPQRACGLGDTAFFFSDRRPLCPGAFSEHSAAEPGSGARLLRNNLHPRRPSENKGWSGDGHFGTTARSLGGLCELSAQW